LDDIKDKQIIPRTIAERRTIHKSMRKEKKWVNIIIIIVIVIIIFPMYINIKLLSLSII